MERVLSSSHALDWCASDSALVALVALVKVHSCEVQKNITTAGAVCSDFMSLDTNGSLRTAALTRFCLPKFLKGDVNLAALGLQVRHLCYCSGVLHKSEPHDPLHFR